MRSKILSNGESPEDFIAEGCFIRELHRDESEALSLAEARVLPGTRTRLHALNVREYYFIRSGFGQMYLDGVPAGLVKSGDLVCIEAGTSQAIENTGPADLIFLCICHPAFRNEGYRDCEPRS